MKRSLFFLFLFAANYVFCQEAINQLDTLGKKNGKWTVYLDERWNELKDSTKAVYYRYTYYDHGANTIPLSSKGMSPIAKAEKPSGEILEIGHPIPMDGTYRWSDRKGTIGLQYDVKKGEMVGYREYWRNGKIRLEIDYTHQFMEQPYTYEMWFTDKKGKRGHYFHQKVGKWGWIDYEAPLEPDSITKTVMRKDGDTLFVSENWYWKGRAHIEAEKIYFKDKGHSFFDGMYHGKNVEWSANGQKLHEGEFRFGVAMPGWKRWNPDGTLREEK